MDTEKQNYWAGRMINEVKRLMRYQAISDPMFIGANRWMKANAREGMPAIRQRIERFAANVRTEETVLAN